jgi:hypothetical protein
MTNIEFFNNLRRSGSNLKLENGELILAGNSTKQLLNFGAGESLFSYRGNTQKREGNSTLSPRGVKTSFAPFAAKKTSHNILIMLMKKSER